MFNSGAANNSYVVSIGGKKLQFAMPGQRLGDDQVPGRRTERDDHPGATHSMRPGSSNGAMRTPARCTNPEQSALEATALFSPQQGRAFHLVGTFRAESPASSIAAGSVRRWARARRSRTPPFHAECGAPRQFRSSSSPRSRRSTNVDRRDSSMPATAASKTACICLRAASSSGVPSLSVGSGTVSLKTSRRRAYERRACDARLYATCRTKLRSEPCSTSSSREETTMKVRCTSS